MSLLIKEEIADIILRKIKDPRLGFVTVTDVEMTQDLKMAKIYISVMQEETEGLSISILNSAKGMIRTELNKRIRVKFVPTLDFRIDESIDRGSRIDKLLKEIKED